MTSPRRFDIRERSPAIVAVLLIGLTANLAAAFLLNLPRAEEVRSLRAAAEDLEVRLTRRERKVEALRADYERVMEGRRSLETFYADVLSTKHARMTSIQKEIRDIAARFNISPKSISYSRDLYKGEKIVKFSVVLPLNGSYEHLRAFIAALEASENLLIIESVTLADSKEGGVILSLQINVSTYFIDPDMAGPGPAGVRLSRAEPGAPEGGPAGPG